MFLNIYFHNTPEGFVKNLRYSQLKGIQEISLETMEVLAEAIGATARKYGIEVQSCCEDYDL